MSNQLSPTFPPDYQAAPNTPKKAVKKFTHDQRAKLLDAYATHDGNPTGPVMQDLAARIGDTLLRVKNWFRAERGRRKKAAPATAAPPRLPTRDLADCVGVPAPPSGSGGSSPSPVVPATITYLTEDTPERAMLDEELRRLREPVGRPPVESQPAFQFPAPAAAAAAKAAAAAIDGFPAYDPMQVTYATADITGAIQCLTDSMNAYAGARVRPDAEVVATMSTAEIEDVAGVMELHAKVGDRFRAAGETFAGLRQAMEDVQDGLRRLTKRKLHNGADTQFMKYEEAMESTFADTRNTKRTRT